MLFLEGISGAQQNSSRPEGRFGVCHYPDLREVGLDLDYHTTPIPLTRTFHTKWSLSLTPRL